MTWRLDRRSFVKAGSAAVVGALTTRRAKAGDERNTVRVGLVGVGYRGSNLLRILPAIEGVEVRALCDVIAGRVQAAQEAVTKAGGKKPEGYTKGEEDYLRLMAREDLDAVLIATPWEWHTRMAVAGMKAGKYVGVEVPAALKLKECWELVNTSVETGKPCMVLENWSFRRDNLAVLNMIRKGLLGAITHCHCSYSHNFVRLMLDRKDKANWAIKHVMTQNGSQYVNHGLGPVLSWMNINCGDRFSYLTSTATRTAALYDQLKRLYGAYHPMAMLKYAQGDIVTTVVKTEMGSTLVVNYDTQTPRPYDNRWMAQGTRGIYDEAHKSVYLEGVSPKREQWEPFEPYQAEYEHSWWKELTQEQQKFGHEGTDYVELFRFIKAVRDRTQTPLDVYDSATMASIVELSELSIAKRSAAVDCPDFTRGQWKNRKPTFAVEG